LNKRQKKKYKDIQQNQIQSINQEQYDKKMNFSSLDTLFTNARTSTASTSSSYTQESIDTYLKSPYSYSDKLRVVSDYFYYKNGVYKNLINSFANFPTLDNVIIPTKGTLQKSTDKAYNTYLSKINTYVDSIGIKPITRKILRSVARYGGFVGYERTNGSQTYLQTLPIDYCRVKYQVGYEMQVEFNFKYFDNFYQQEDIDLAWLVYPPEFQKLYNAYKSDTQSLNPQWQMIDIKKTWCILFDDDEPFFIPPFSSVFNSILSNENFESLAKIGEELDITKIITQKIPTDTKTGKVLIPKDQVKVFHKFLTSITPEGASSITSPFDIDSVSLTDQNRQKQNMLDQSLSNVFVDSGMSKALFADNGGNSALSANIEVSSANIYAILEKIEQLINIKFNYVVSSKNYTFQLHFYRTTNLNIKDNFDKMYQMVSIGGSLSMLYSMLGIQPDAYDTLLQVEDMNGMKENLKIPPNMNTQSTDPNSEVGSPKKDETQLSDSGAKSKNNDDNNPLVRN
jgi:hypothetical protein